MNAVSDLDAFQFYGAKDERIVITAVTTFGDLDTAICLYPPGGGPAEACTHQQFSGGDKLDHPLQQEGLYTIVIEDRWLRGTGDYNITSLKIPGAVSFPGDPDGGAIASGETLSGMMDAASDLDAFQFYGAAGDWVVITAVITSGDLDTALCLYPPDGRPTEDGRPAEACTHTQFSGGDKLDHQLLQSGLYTILIEDRFGRATGDYNISFSFTNDPSTPRPGIYNPSPPDKAALAVPSSCSLLSWDPVGGATGYDLYFGEDVVEPLEKIGDNLPSPSFPCPALEEEKVYYWHVVAHTPGGDIEGPYWWFQVGEDLVADLLVTKTDSPDPVLAGQNITYTVVVTNNGSNTATDATLRDTTPANTTFQSIAVPPGWNCPTIPPVDGIGAITCINPSLVLGASSTFTIIVKVNAGTATGTTITSIATVSSTTPDSNPSNNRATAATTVATPKPDLVETAVTNPPGTAAPGNWFSVTDTAHNQGTASSNPSTTRYYLSLDTLKNPGDKLLWGSRWVPGLAPEASSTGTVTITIPSDTALGEYFLLACADDTNVVVELNEGNGNNCKASGTTVKVGWPDLVETAVTNPPGTAAPGSRFSVTDTAHNQGTASSNPSTTRYYLSLDTLKNPGDKLL